VGRRTAPARYADGLENMLCPVAQLHTLAGNPRRGDVDAVARSLAEFGQRKPIVVRRATNEVTAGNHTLLAAAQLGWEHVAVVWTDDDALRAKAFALADNRTHDLGGYDDAALRAMLGDVAVDAQLLAAASFSHADLARLVAHAAPPDGIDELPPPLAIPVTAAGDLWLLGEHRLLCGDARRPVDLERLTAGRPPGCVLTDPPYGIDVQGSGGGIGLAKEFPRIIGDREPFDPGHLLELAPSVVLWGGNHYAGRLPDSSAWLVWDKRDGDHHNQFADAELAWTNGRGVARVFRHMWMGYVRASERGEPRVHPTQKPVALMSWCMEQVAATVVLDPYAGSGTTVIAAQLTGRTASLMEIDPAYCDVICARWQALTHQLPVLAATGEEHDFS
jgi:hypothetical protein